MPPKSKPGPIILSKEAQSAVRHNQPTDTRLINILNGSASHGFASRPLQRWMAAQILGQYGYKFNTGHDFSNRNDNEEV